MMKTVNRLFSAIDHFVFPIAMPQQAENRRARLLAWMLMFVSLFSITVIILLLVIDPHHNPANNQYVVLISGLAASFGIAFIVNRAGHYRISAPLLVAGAMLAPWISLNIDPLIFQGDYVPLTYLIFSILLSGIFLSIAITCVVAIIQFTGAAILLASDPAFSSFNWFSFLAFVILTSLFGIIANFIIQRDLKQITDQARQLAENKELLREHAIRDDLTNLFNRRYLDEILHHEIQRATRSQSSIGLIMLDIDNFKHINDSLGHSTGDIVLREFGRFLSAQIRQADLAFRYAGDEFVLILPDISRVKLIERAEHLRTGAKTIDLPVSITISIGVSVFPDDGMHNSSLLQTADVALLRAKHAGGNCTE